MTIQLNNSWQEICKWQLLAKTSLVTSRTGSLRTQILSKFLSELLERETEKRRRQKIFGENEELMTWNFDIKQIEMSMHVSLTQDFQHCNLVIISYRSRSRIKIRSRDSYIFWTWIKDWIRFFDSKITWLAKEEYKSIIFFQADWSCEDTVDFYKDYVIMTESEPGKRSCIRKIPSRDFVSNAREGRKIWGTQYDACLSVYFSFGSLFFVFFVNGCFVKHHDTWCKEQEDE